MAIATIIKEHITSLVALCKKYGVERLYVFGSVATGKFNPDTSDIDFIVELEELSPMEKGERILSLWSELESLFQRKVDLLTDKPIVNSYFRKSVEKSKSLIYDNQIIHNYDEVDESLVWAIIHNHLPLLKKEAEEGLSRRS